MVATICCGYTYAHVFLLLQHFFRHQYCEQCWQSFSGDLLVAAPDRPFVGAAKQQTVGVDSFGFGMVSKLCPQGPLCPRTLEELCDLQVYHRGGLHSGRFRSREVSGRFSGRFWYPRPKTRPRKTNDLSAICESIWASDLQHNSRTPE